VLDLFASCMDTQTDRDVLCEVHAAERIPPCAGLPRRRSSDRDLGTDIRRAQPCSLSSSVVCSAASGSSVVRSTSSPARRTAFSRF
jgi:hypothetical protein